MQRWRNNTDVANTKHEVSCQTAPCVRPMSLTSRRVQVPPQLMKRAASVLSARRNAPSSAPSYAEETVALEEESRQADLAKSADRSNRRGFTTASPTRSRSTRVHTFPAAPAPPRARVSTPWTLKAPSPRGADGAFRFKGWPQFLPNSRPPR